MTSNKFQIGLFVRISIIYLLCLLMCGFGLSATVLAGSTSSYPIVSSQHKFPADAEEDDGVQATAADVVIISRGNDLIKRRPKNYGGAAPVSTNLQRKISAKSAIVMDAASGEVVYARSPDMPWQPASTIKILTGLISIDSLSGREMVKVSKNAARMPRSKVYLSPGKKYPASDLINQVLLASANDASVALAEQIAGSEEVFAKLMTAKARSLGASNTICKTSSGLTQRGQQSTARDLALIFNRAMENEQFADMMAKRQIKNKNGSMVYSHNKALWRIDGTIGGKTGYTNAARQTYVGKFKRGETELVVAFLGSETMWDDAKRLVEYGFAKKAESDRLASYVPGKGWSAVKLGDNGQAGNPIVISNLRE